MYGSRLLIVGCGYVGMQVAHRARDLGLSVWALTRSHSRFEELRGVGITPIAGDWLQASTLQSLASHPVDFVLVAVPHRADKNSEDNLEAGVPPEESEAMHVRGLQNLLEALPQGWQRLCYLSTTGVFGEDSQQAVDEDTPVSPTRIGPRMAYAAEQWLLSSPARERTTILRLAGIYGPGRIPLQHKIRSGEPLAVPRGGYLNLAHRDDIAQAILQVFAQPLERSLYLFSDGKPVQRDLFYRKLAEKCGLDEPEFVEPDPNSPRARRATDKRIDPSRFLRETKLQLRFPDYRSGLNDAVEGSQGK